MAKNLTLNVKNEQLAAALKIKAPAAAKPSPSSEGSIAPTAAKPVAPAAASADEADKRRVRARTRSVHAREDEVEGAVEAAAPVEAQVKAAELVAPAQAAPAPQPVAAPAPVAAPVPAPVVAPVAAPVVAPVAAPAAPAPQAAASEPAKPAPVKLGPVKLGPVLGANGLPVRKDPPAPRPAAAPVTPAAQQPSAAPPATPARPASSFASLPSSRPSQPATHTRSGHPVNPFRQATQRFEARERAQETRPNTPPSQANINTPPKPYINPLLSAARAAQFSDPKASAPVDRPRREALGPTGRHVRELAPPPPRPKPVERPAERPNDRFGSRPGAPGGRPAPGAPRGPRTDAPLPLPDEDSKKPRRAALSGKDRKATDADLATLDVGSIGAGDAFGKGKKPAPTKGYSKDKYQSISSRGGEDSYRGPRRGKKGSKIEAEDLTVRPTTLKVRLPIMLKDLAAELKLKASQLIQKLFMQGTVVTLNSILDDEIMVQLLGHEFGCEITIDTSEAERIQVTAKTVREEIAATDSSKLTIRPPVVTFMGHVDHGKTSLIDAIRSSNVAAGEAGAITQHIGAFQCDTKRGKFTLLDTPGHEAFAAMRARGADVTDVVVLVVAGDEGMRQQTIEAISHAKNAKVPILVAINKCDKPNFNAETVYRQLSEQELLPEAWGGDVVTVNCSAMTKEGLDQLLELIALQAEVFGLKADPTARARGAVIESQMSKGFGIVATVLVQNGTLKRGDSLVFDQTWGRVKTMHDENGQSVEEAGPSCPVRITGLFGLPEAGNDFITVASDREAREIAEKRADDLRDKKLLLRSQGLSMESLLSAKKHSERLELNCIIRADVQGSLEALKTSLGKIKSDKISLNIIAASIGQISEADLEQAKATKAIILGFHTRVAHNAELLAKQMDVTVLLHDIIYHAVDDVKAQMTERLPPLAQESHRGTIEVRAVFKSSGLGSIAGCMVTEGAAARKDKVRVMRGKEVVWTGSINSLKRVKDDVKEVVKGFECGVLLDGFKDYQEGDIFDVYEIIYVKQDL